MWLAVVVWSLGSVGGYGQVWNNSAGGNWGNAGNWNGGVPNTQDAIADFSQLDLLSGVTVTVDGSYSVGSLVFGNTDANPAASWTLNGNGNPANGLNLSSSSGVATITVGNLGAGQSATINASLTGGNDLMVNGPGTLVLGGNNSYGSSGTTSVTNGATLVIGAANTLPANTALFLGDYASGTLGNLTVANNQTIKEFITQGLIGESNVWWPTPGSFNIPTNLITIPGGQTLSVNGNAIFGFNPSVSHPTANLVAMSGGGTLAVNDNGGFFRVGASDQPTTSSAQTTILDMSSLASANINLGNNSAVGASTFYIGDLSTVAAITGSNVISELILASNTTITANCLFLGPGERLNPAILQLGSGSNIFNVNSNLFGIERDWGQMSFYTNTGTYQLRAADGVSRAAVLGLGWNVSGANAYPNQYVDFGNHYADLLLSLLRIGFDRRGGTCSNYFGFANGILNTTELDVGVRSGNPSAAGTWKSVCNLGGGTVIVGTNGIVMGTSAGTYASTTATNWAVLNISGGFVTVNGDIVLMTQKAATGLETAISTLNITGGTNMAMGGIYTKKYVASPGPHQSTLSLNGGVLDLTEHAIGGVDSTGSSTNTVPWVVDNLNFQAGTLRNVAQINGGLTPLVKSGSGVLTLAGTNTYTGGTIISNGTLIAANDASLGLGNVSVMDGATLTLGMGLALTSSYISSSNDLILNGTPMVNLNYTGTDAIGGLSFDGGATFQAPGTWGSMTSGAANKTELLQGQGLLLVQTASLLPTMISLAYSTNGLAYGQSAIFTATVTSPNGVPTGTVTFYDGVTVLGIGTLNGGVATFATSDLPIGTNSITAVYNSDRVYDQSTSVNLSPVVNLPSPTIRLILSTATNLVLQSDNTVPNYNYILESAASLAPSATWTMIATNAGTGGNITNLTLINPGIAQLFFRYQVLPGGTSFEVAEQAGPKAVIVIGQNATEVEQFAASEFQSYIAQITGSSQEIPIINDQQAEGLLTTNEIIIGQPQTNLRLSQLCNEYGLMLDTNLLSDDGYIVKSLSDGANNVLILSGSNNRSSLFAVYHFLETCGVRFFGYKSRNGEIVPSQNKVMVPVLNIISKPVMKYRFVSDNGVSDTNTMELTDIADWGAKNRCNAFMLTPAQPGESWDTIPLDEIQKRGFLIAGPGHVLAELTPSTNLFQAHPEYFPLINGVRNMEYSATWGGAVSFCYNNAMQIVVSNAVAYYQQYPFIDLLAIYPPDGSQHSVQCQDSVCSQLSESDWYLIMLNDIDTALRQLPTHPKLMWIAYDELSVPPTNTVPVYNGEDFILEWCNQIRDFAAPMDSPSNQVAAQCLQWNTSLKSICTDWKSNPGNQDLAAYYRWESWGNFLKSFNYQGSAAVLEYYNGHVSESLGIPMLSYFQSGPWPDNLMQTDFEFYTSQGISGWQNCTDYYNDNPTPYWNQLSAQLMWNPSANVNVLDQDFYQQLYGTASTVMQNYWDAMWPDVSLLNISLQSSNQVAQLSTYLNSANTISAQTNNPTLKQWLKLANTFQTHALNVESNNIQNYNADGSPK